MSLFKRLSATLTSHIDQVVGEIENHDAVIQASLKEMHRKVATAKVHLGQVRREEERLRRQIQEQKENARRWKQRALECAPQDEARALACLDRRRQCQEQTERLSHTLGQYEQTAGKLLRDIEASEQRLLEIRQKLTCMRARQSTRLAADVVNAPDHDTGNMLDDAFERWEIHISQAELAGDRAPPADPVEREFMDRERQEELREELAALLAGEEKK